MNGYNLNNIRNKKKNSFSPPVGYTTSLKIKMPGMYG